MYAYAYRDASERVEPSRNNLLSPMLSACDDDDQHG